MSAMHRTSGGRVIGSVFSNATGYAVRLAAILVTTPLFIRALGDARYGSWVLLWAIASYLTILDLGLGLAIRKFVARALATGDRAELNAKFSACLSVYIALGAIVLIAGLPFVGFATDFMHLDPSVRRIAWRIAIFLVIDVALSFPMNAFQGLLTAYQRYELTNAIRVGMEVVRNVALVLAARAGMDLDTLAAIQLGSDAIACLLIIAAATAIARPLAVRLFRLDRRMLMEILGYSGWVVAYLASVSVLNLSSANIVGIFVDETAAAKFSVAFRLVAYLAAIPSLMTNVLVPLASEREAQADWPSLRRVFTIGGSAQAFVLAPAAVGALLLGGAFFQVWLGPNYLESATYLILLVVPIVLSQGTASSIALGAGRQKALTLISVGTAVVTIALACPAAWLWGAMGVSAAYAVVGSIGNLLIYARCCGFLDLPPMRTLMRIWGAPVAAALVMAGALLIAMPALRPAAGYPSLAFSIAAAIAVYSTSIGAIWLVWPEALPFMHKLLEVGAKALSLMGGRKLQAILDRSRAAQKRAW